MDDAAIHRVSGDADGFVCSCSEGQWIATGYALAMTRCGDGCPRDDNNWRKGMVRADISLFTLHSSLLKSRRSVRLASGSASGQDFPRSPTTAVGNLHGSPCRCRGYRGCCCRA